MQAWMEGYESDIEYTAGYYREQEPDFLNLCALTHKVEPRNLAKGFTYCELGCGQGMTSLIMAANYPQSKFYALDFNPSHIARARDLAEQAGLDNIVFLERSFAQVMETPELLPECDFITFHGIFSWISEENRQYLIDICQRHLKPGGVVYNSYNAKPGWLLGEPIQQLMLTARKLFSGNSLEQFAQARGLLKELEGVNPGFFAVNKDLISKRLTTLDSGNPHYLVHEYFNEGWRAFYFTEIAAYLLPSKLEFIGEASTAAASVTGLLSAEVRQLLDKISDRHVRELFKDVMLNTTFRKDIYMRGVSNRLDVGGQVTFLRQQQWVLRKVLTEKDKADFTFKLPIGNVSGRAEVYQGIVACLEGQIRTFDELQQSTKLSLKDLVQALMFLYHAGTVGMHYGNDAVSAARRLNQVLAGQLFSSTQTIQGHSYVALPAVRGSLALGMTDMLFFRAVLALGEVGNSDTLVNHAARELASRGLNLKHEGKTLVGEPMRERLYALEQVWRQTVLPVLQSGGAVN
jgi:SAM-dependent methyltransferase